MPIIDQYSAIINQQQALVPDSQLIDGRTEKDWLCFLSGFGNLVNFYNKDNQHSGNWRPFLLKDPLFLTATIAGTPFKQLHTLYLNTIKSIKSLITTSMVGSLFNQLFDQLNDVFMYIKQWIGFMQSSDKEYTLKNYIINESTVKISPYFWAFNSLRQNLFLSTFVEGITPVNTSRFHTYSDYQEQVWRKNKDKSPYWELLNLKHPITKNTPLEILNAITNVGDRIFHFFHTAIHHADIEFEKIKIETNGYPDTVLIRSFIELLKIHQKQLNGLSQKHLQFYYDDILKQKKQGAQPDSAFIYTTLSKKSAYTLPEGTLFNAGLDSQKQPILFVNTKSVSLTPTLISDAFTLSIAKNAIGFYMPYVQDIPEPSTIKKDEIGQTEAWQTFGGADTTIATKTNFGIAFASPMLLLKEGNRTITFSFNFATTTDLRQLKNARYYLSTQKKWLNVTAFTVFPNFQFFGESQEVVITLEAIQPAIECFDTNPDGITAKWPLIKIIFDAVSSPTTPPILNSLDISVAVAGIKTFQLYNDYGTLSTKNPYPLFGPSPVYNNNFIIGNNEILSKPFNSLYFELDWDKLPNNFEDYYKEYNTYFENNKERAKNRGNIWNRITGKGSNNDDTTEETVFSFNNYCFTVEFKLLQNNDWNSISMTKLQNIAINENNTIMATPYPITEDTPQPDDELLLFSTDDTTVNGTLTEKSFFGYTPVNEVKTRNSFIQLVPLKYSDTSKAGLIKMVLNGPQYGFGAEIYPKVVTNIALNNAAILINNAESFFGISRPIKESANIPYTPKLDSLTAYYTASETYDFTSKTPQSALECFMYSPFSNYKIYNKLNIDGLGIALYPTYTDKGYLYIVMDTIIPSNNLNIYFELSGSYDGEPDTEPINYYYLSKSGWETLPLIADGTNNFSCTGIITVNIPKDISKKSPLMPLGKYYIAIGVNNPSQYAKSIIVAPNGFCVSRTSTISWKDKNNKPQIAANAITQPQTAIPEIATVVQPFPSFGGKAAENRTAMNIRVSNRIKTKDRAITNGDYFRTIREQHSFIFYSKPIYNTNSKKLDIYVVKACESPTEADAFLPQINSCQKEKIADYLNARAGAFSQCSVHNFSFQYVKVNASVIVSEGYDTIGLKKAINTAINLFISPWISSDAPQITIDTSITDIEIASCICSVDGVVAANNISFVTWACGNPYINVDTVTSVTPANTATLLVSYMNHHILINPTS
ncbi:hypothetical protein DVK85_09090 [Flavobacterium arcticum]|uniref:Baseplate protein J-like domain-containing protein n=1 Tax=Flavobacterium arcticum TaxID=1784713 RepID=A0A345HCR7_9FLAO|nr:hypothetical protein [Flavobacterium arcticum]AXG74377.1 hypothetical protein DVK85_09090 [Flavobacterium arcticum]KAF2507508.1 hypothetical protein E0W72_11560 [Flavobacterium arcticum]